jgi:hypothetical protein
VTLPASGTISLSQVSVELGRAATATTSLGETAVRNMAGVASGAIGMSNLHGKSAMSAVGVPDTGSYSSAGAGGTATADPSVTVTGGVAPITYLWSFTSNPDGCSLANATSQTCQVSKAYAAEANGETVPVLQCVITDANTTITVTGVTATLMWSNGA